jgi:hypothetical protein
VPPTARTLTGALAWLGAVVVATVVGLMAVNAIGAGLVGPGQRVLDATEVDARLAAAGPAPTPAPTSAPPTSAPASAAASVVIPSAGGIVVARCVDGVGVDVVSATPNQGWGTHDDAEEDRGRVRFESGNRRVELRLSCVGGRPQANIRDD